MSKVNEENLIKTIINSTKSVDGVLGFNARITDNLQQSFFRTKPQDLGIKYSFDDEDGCNMDLYLTVEYGSKIPDIAWDVQTSVKNGLKRINVKHGQINIHIQDVDFKEE